MDVLETRLVGRKVQLFLVKVAGRVVLLASNGENVTSVAEFAEDELPLEEPAKRQHAESGFGSLLKSLGRARR
jgi:flagellar biogenesis protein FliO